MKHLIFFFIGLFSITAIGCKPQSVISKTTQSEKKDGSSYETAIVVKSIKAEYEWIANNYPRAKVIMQSLQFQEKNPFDVLKAKLPDGSEKSFYFDISSFFGKF